jgi:zeaxanthin glucosyltransferase
MAHFAFIAPPLPGHFNPLLVLADALVARGHRATFVNQCDAEALVRGHDVGFAAIGRESHPPGALERRVRSMGRLGGPFGLKAMIRDVAAGTAMFAREAPAVLERIGADILVCDQMEAGGGLAARALGLPYASVATALPINREPQVPPPYLAWRYDPSERGVKRNRGGWRVSDWLMRPVARTIAAHAARLGIGAADKAEDLLSERLQIAQCVRGLDYPRAELPVSFHYLGPFRPPDDADAWQPPATLAADPRPFLFCSFGTLQGARAGLFRKVAEAAKAAGCRLLIAHGGRLDAAAIRRLPRDTWVEPWVPQRAVLARASLAITHCGFNTVLDALSMGVPLLSLPLAFEQPATAARIERAGAGRTVTPLRAGKSRLQREIGTLLGDPAYAARAGALGREIAAAGGVSRAADLLEEMLG